MPKESRAYIYNANRDRIIVKRVEIVSSETNDDISYIMLSGSLVKEEITQTRDDIYTFLNGDLSVLTEEYDIVLAPARSKLSALQHVANEYTGYTSDPVCHIDGNNFTIYIEKENYALCNAKQNKEDILDLMEAITDVYAQELEGTNA